MLLMTFAPSGLGIRWIEIFILWNEIRVYLYVDTIMLQELGEHIFAGCRLKLAVNLFGN